MGGRGSASAAGRGKSGGVRYLSADKALYESDSEVLYVERLITRMTGVSGGEVLSAKSDGNGNITLSFATANDYHEQNSKTSYALYELKSGITNAPDIHGSRLNNPNYGYGTGPDSMVKAENIVGIVRSVGIDWSRVNSVSGQTYKVKDLLKSKGFKWNSAGKNWVKPNN